MHQFIEWWSVNFWNVWKLFINFLKEFEGEKNKIFNILIFQDQNFESIKLKAKIPSVLAFRRTISRSIQLERNIKSPWKFFFLYDRYMSEYRVRMQQTKRIFPAAKSAK